MACLIAHLDCRKFIFKHLRNTGVLERIEFPFLSHFEWFPDFLPVVAEVLRVDFNVPGTQPVGEYEVIHGRREHAKLDSVEDYFLRQCYRLLFPVLAAFGRDSNRTCSKVEIPHA